MDLIEVLRKRVQEKLDERQTAQTELDAVLTAPTAEGRDLNDSEAKAFAETKSKIATIDSDLKSAEERLAGLVATEEARNAAQAMAAKYPTEPVESKGGAKVGAEARTYTRLAERRDGVSFLRDMVAAQFDGDSNARERLSQHMVEMRKDGLVETRAAGTGAFAGLTVPQYLTDMVAPAVAAMRPLANICNPHPLPPDGMTVNISRITTATSAALQASENSATSETNIDDTLLSPAVLTIAGQQTLSRQAIDRGTGTEDVTVGDLIRRYHTTLDSTLLNQASTGLNAAAGISVAYTDASPTGAELYPKLFDLIQQVQTAVFMGVTHFVMHPRRWAWLASQVGTSWPFLQINGAGVQTAGAYGGTGTYDTSVTGTTIAGTLAGVPVIVDGSITVTAGGGAEDRIYGVTSYEAHLWEDPAAPLYIRAEQTLAASLGVLFVVYGYMAYTFQRYASAHGLIQGTGLTTPTF